MTNLDVGLSGRVVREVMRYYSETIDEFVIRRHRELQNSGKSNPVIFEQIVREVDSLRFPVRTLTERKVRRIIYG